MSGDDSLCALEQRRQALLERLAALSGDETGPAPIATFQLAYWHSVLQRAARQREAVAQSLVDKVEAAITALQTSSSTAKEDSAGRSASAADSHSLRAQSQQRLAQLNHVLSHQEPLLPDASPAALLHIALAEQDRLFWAAMGPPQPEATNAGASARRQGLQAARDLSATRARFQLDQLLATALAHQPEFPGPLNPQRLLVRLLTRLHDASPAYLMRTLDHSRTLFGMQQSEKAGNPPRGERKLLKTRSPG